MATAAYLKIDGIKCEPMDAEHQGWIQIFGLHWGRESAPKRDRIVGGHTAERLALGAGSFRGQRWLTWPGPSIPVRTCPTGRTIPKAKVGFIRARNPC